MNRYKYYISRSDASHPNLMVEVPGQAGQIYAENITDLQFRYVLSSGAIVDVPAISGMVREVLISIDARNNRLDPDAHGQYRTRELTTRVKVRNLGVN
jgi:hypothetical protein